jgi:hypothetical protein
MSEDSWFKMAVKEERRAQREVLDRITGCAG